MLSINPTCIGWCKYIQFYYLFFLLFIKKKINKSPDNKIAPWRCIYISVHHSSIIIIIKWMHSAIDQMIHFLQKSNTCIYMNFLPSLFLYSSLFLSLSLISNNFDATINDLASSRNRQSSWIVVKKKIQWHNFCFPRSIYVDNKTQ